MKKFISVLTALSLSAAVFSGCAKDEPDPVNELRETVYVAQNIPIPEGLNTNSFRFINGGIALFDIESGVSAIDYDGNIIEQIKFSDADPDSMVCFDIDSSGNYWALKADFNAESQTYSGFVLYKFDKSGAMTENIQIEEGFWGVNEELAYPAKLISEGDYIYLQSYQAVYVIDRNGSLAYEFLIDADKYGGNAYMKAIFRLSDGRVAANFWGIDESSYNYFSTVSVLDPVSKKAADYKIETGQESSSDYLFAGGGEYDALMCTNVGIYNYQLESGSQTGIMNFLDYGINVQNLVDLTLMDDGSLLCVFRDLYGAISEITRYIAADPSEVPEKKTITLSALMVDYWLKEYIADFNKNSVEYRIELKSYSEGGADSADALVKFNADLMSGDVPDIIVNDSYAATQGYTKKGLFADLYEIMEGDPDFNKDEYLANAFASLELDGKLYEMFPMYFINTITAKISDAGENPGWTLDEFSEFIGSKPEAEYILDDYTRKDFITVMVQNLFIDPKTGECKFDRAEFEKILKIAERFPTEGLSPDADAIAFFSGLKDGDPVIHRTTLMRFRSMREDEVIFFGEDAMFKGYPGPAENGSYFVPCAKFAIAEKSDNKEGAWSFLKYMLEGYKDDYNIYLPAKLSELERIKYESLSDPYYIDADGAKVEYENEVTMNGVDMIYIGNNTEEDADKVMELILSTKNVMRRDDIVSDILAEEIDAYLAGNKSAEEAVDVIENRVNLYISESGE